MDWKTAGILLIGLGVLLLGISSAYFFIIQMRFFSQIPTTHLFVVCHVEDNTAIINVDNSGMDPLYNLSVFLDGKKICDENSLPPSSNFICKEENVGELPIVKVVATTEDGRRIYRSTTCGRITTVVPETVGD